MSSSPLPSQLSSPPQTPGSTKDCMVSFVAFKDVQVFKVEPEEPYKVQLQTMTPTLSDLEHPFTHDDDGSSDIDEDLGPAYDRDLFYSADEISSSSDCESDVESRPRAVKRNASVIKTGAYSSGGEEFHEDDDGGISDYEEQPRKKYKASSPEAITPKVEPSSDAQQPVLEEHADDYYTKFSKAAQALTPKFAQQRIRGRKWTWWDEYVVTILKEGYDYSWRQISKYMKTRHSWQGIQMYYLRTIRKRNWKLTSSESARFANVVKNDWDSRFERIAHAMGSEYTPRRLVRHMMANAEMFYLLGGGIHDGYGENDEASFQFPGMDEEPPASEKDLKIIRDPGALPEKALEFLTNHEVKLERELFDLYLCPTY